MGMMKAILFFSTHGFDKTIAMVNIRATLEKLHLCDNNLICKLRKIHFKTKLVDTQKLLFQKQFCSIKSAIAIDQKKERCAFIFSKNHQSIKSETYRA